MYIMFDSFVSSAIPMAYVTGSYKHLSYYIIRSRGFPQLLDR